MNLFKKLLKRGFSSVGFSLNRNQKVSNSEKGNLLIVEEEQDFQFQWVSDGGFATVIDVGANAGQFALKIRKLLPLAQLYSFEPIPLVFDELLVNFKDDKYFKGFNCALGSIAEERTINLNEYSPSSSLLSMEEEHKKHFDYAREQSPLVIKVERMDDIFANIKIEKPILMKIDVQGFEEQVIEGGNRTLMEAKMIIIEVSFKQLYLNQPIFDDIYTRLKTFGFKYSGNYEQLISPKNGEILQADAIFIK